MRMVRLVLLIWLGLAAGAMADVTGRIAVVDGDTLRVGGERVRLHGIDAPEMDQTCTRPSGETWRCGAWSAEQVRRAYEGRRAVCRRIDTDRYGRMVARCEVDGADMGATLVYNGLATAFVRYSDAYVEHEKAAIVAGRGIFSSRLEPPSSFRAGSAPPPPAACAIKGNISGNGRIYHMPGQEHYDRTRIDTARGERWFCSEAEARAAGWRRARR